MTAAGRKHHVVVASQGTGCVLEVDGVAHHVDRDEGIAVRAQWPALIVSVAVEIGQDVAEGDPLVVAEAMKMESTLRAPFAGTITSVAVLPNEQVDAGAPLVLIRPDNRGDAAPIDAAGPGRGSASPGWPWPTRPAAPRSSVSTRPSAATCSATSSTPRTLTALLAEQRSFANRASAGDTKLLAAEDAFLDLFTDLGLLWRSERDVAAHEDRGVTTAREYLLGYIQWLDPDRIGLPSQMRRRLGKVLARYGVADLYRNPDLEQAVVLLFGSQARRPQLARVVTGDPRAPAALPGPDPAVRRRLGADPLRPTDASTQGQLEAISDLSRDAALPLHRRAPRRGRTCPDPGPHGGPPRRPRRGPEPA